MISLFISTGSAAVIPRHVGKFGHIGPFSQILPEIAHLRAKQTLFTRAAVPVGLSRPVPPGGVPTHPPRRLRLQKPADGSIVADSVCVDA